MSCESFWAKIELAVVIRFLASRGLGGGGGEGERAQQKPLLCQFKRAYLDSSPSLPPLPPSPHNCSANALGTWREGQGLGTLRKVPTMVVTSSTKTTWKAKYQSC